MLNQKRTHLTVEERGWIIDLAAYALPVVDIARILKRSTSVVYQTLQDLDIPAKASERTDDHIAIARQQATPLTPPAEPLYQDRREIQPAEQLAKDMGRLEGASGTTNLDLSLNTFLCANCGETYSMTSEHMDWFRERNLHPPKRCEPCREERRGTHDYDAGKDAANLAQVKLEKQVLAQIEDLRGRVETTIGELADVVDIINAVSLMFAPSQAEEPRLSGTGAPHPWQAKVKGYLTEDSEGRIVERPPYSDEEEHHSDLDTIDLDHDLGTRDQHGPFGEEQEG